MKAPRAVKRWIAIRRKYEGRGNGVIPWLWDAPVVEIQMDKNKRRHSRKWVREQ